MNNKEFTCKECGKLFKANVSGTNARVFCSRECRYACHNRNIGKEKRRRSKEARDAETPKQYEAAARIYIQDRILKEGDCWLWTGTISHDKSAKSKFRKKGGSASRLSWRAYNGVEAPVGKVLYRRCKDTLCVNPEHLFVANVIETRKCIFCGKEFTAREVQRKSYCSDSCANTVRARNRQAKLKSLKLAEPIELKLKRLRGRIEGNKIEDLNGCWNWTGTTKAGSHKYGRLKVVDLFGDGQKMVIASRASYLAYYGAIPKGLNVLHHCDNPQCVNPKHLYTGTSLQNSRDIKISKVKRFEKDGLTVQQVRMIKERLSFGVSALRLAKDFVVALQVIRNIKYGKTWKDV